MHMAAVNPDADDRPVRAFSTFTGDLHDMARWFKACGVTSVAMESTGVYWIPAFEVLEEHGFHVILVNARYAKNVLGCKTDVNDVAWLQRLHSYGLLRSSFRRHPCRSSARINWSEPAVHSYRKSDFGSTRSGAYLPLSSTIGRFRIEQQHQGNDGQPGKAAAVSLADHGERLDLNFDI